MKWIQTVVLAVMLAVSGVAAASGIDDLNAIEGKPIGAYTSYHYKEDTSWTTWNKVLFGSAIGMYGVGDVVSTIGALDRGCSEGNPLFGKNPDTGVLILGKVVAMGLTWALVEYVTPEENRQVMRNVAYGMLTAAGGLVSIHNASLNCN